MSDLSTHQLAPGVTIEVRDEVWLVTNVARSTDGFRLKVRGLSDYVRDQPATFYTALDKDIQILDPTAVEVIADESPAYRRTRLWLETTLRQTPVPLYQEDLAVADEMLADPLSYQLAAVKKALSPDNLRPRVLIADAVGLGKTLEMGMILAELIRRGRGERILVVTPRHIMEQFQQEMWTRFAIPLVRLDSVGIQQVRQKLPASRNPFTYFPRVIVSMDTLKSPKYRAQLEKVHWDAVVMDEIHNATNVGTQNNQLARTLAPTTDALILASATPHNGDPESFKEILRLLDPTSVAPDGTIDHEAAKRLIIRRHRNSEEVASVVGAKWAERNEPRNIPVDASPEEDAVARELDSTWITPGADNPVKDRLFPWTLVKAFLSSPAALDETLNNRLKRGPSQPERTALERLRELNTAITPENSAKFRNLVLYLQEIGIAKNSDTRVVIFSERVATLHWLQENLTKYLKLPKAAVEIMHGGLTDQEQMRLVDAFKRTDSPIRVLITGDVASEGVNLHSLCHNLVHYDIPWSLIRIQQRNGRIDRYGQTHNPQIATLLLDPTDGGKVGELHVLERLIEREHEAHKLLGDASSLMGKHSEKMEEDTIRDVLRGIREFDDVVANPEDLIGGDLPEGMDEIDWLLAELGLDEDEEDAATLEPQATLSSLYPREIDYLNDALSEAFNGVPQDTIGRGGVGYIEHKNDIAELTPPEDLRRRLDFLPQDYVADRKVKEKLILATSAMRGDERLQAARTGDAGSTWPTAHFLGPLHPVSEWASDRALASLSRRTIPAISGNVAEPTVLLMATLTNRRGQVVSRAFVAATSRYEAQVLPDVVRWIHDIGLGDTAVNMGDAVIPDATNKLIADTVEAARGQLNPMMMAARSGAKNRIGHWLKRSEAWESGRSAGQRSSGLALATKLIDEQRSLANSLEPDRELIRPLALIVPAHQQKEA
ncbi:RNA polymerase-associated protein RapA [Corynebacterium faecale]|uniref:DEAD/DEAH box helicase n=1 Tax=Corynebacterium faecale TaxID=1758466 RepID=UPI0025B354C1|nr:DEAD/DEAH box helicase [Corynebacterium faecale]WJY93477.1 RNA polymerase-associated protein RapA [Corynebacterium faecale]